VAQSVSKQAIKSHFVAAFTCHSSNVSVFLHVEIRVGADLRTAHTINQVRVVEFVGFVNMAIKGD
jgi:hypothetical protein